LQLRFNAPAELETIKANFAFYARMFLVSVSAFYIVLLCGGGFFASIAAAVTENWRLLFPAAAGLAVYMLGANMALADIPSQPTTRYVASFVVMLLTGMLSGVRLPASRSSRRLLAVVLVTAATVIV